MTERAHALDPLRRALERAIRRILGERGTRLAVKVRRRLRRLARQQARRAYLDGHFRRTVIAGRPVSTALPVVMCLWNRPERLPDVLRMLSEQRGTQGIRLVLWVNRPRDAAFYRRIIRSFPLTGAVSSVEMTVSRVNIGGLARFYAIRRLRRDGHTGSVMTFDDDQDIGPDFVATLQAAAAPETIAGVWAFKQVHGYWARAEVEVGVDDEPNYIGTGGAIFDSRLVDDPSFFTDLPDRFSFLEDQWMSARAIRAGWTLRKVGAPFDFVLSERNQMHGLVPLKDEFFAYLRSES